MSILSQKSLTVNPKTPDRAADLDAWFKGAQRRYLPLLKGSDAKVLNAFYLLFLDETTTVTYLALSDRAGLDVDTVMRSVQRLLRLGVLRRHAIGLPTGGRQFDYAPAWPQERVA